MSSPSALPSRDPAAPATVKDATKVTAWGLIFWGAVTYAGVLFARNATASAAVQAGLAEWGAGRMAIPWSDPLAPMPSWHDIGRRAGTGAALGALVAALTVGASIAARSAHIAEVGVSPGLLGVGVVTSLLAAVRDELLKRGVVLRATRGLLPWWASLLACGLCAAAARYGEDRAGAMVLAAEALRGVALGGLWLFDRGAWMAIAASAAWAWVLESVTRGGILDVRLAVEGEPGPASVLVAAAAAGAVVALLRRQAPSQALPKGSARI